MKTLFSLVAASAVSVTSAVAWASGTTCAPGEISGDKLVTANYNGVAQSWNPNAVTVYDYRKCQESNDGGNYLDGMIVALSVGGITPNFEATVAYGGEYRVYAPDAAHDKKKLLLYSSGQPDLNTHKEELLQRAAYHGYHVVATRYWNDGYATPDYCGTGPKANGTFDMHSPSNPYTDITPITYDSCVIRLHRNQFENWSPNFTTSFIGPSGALCNPGSNDPDVCNGTPYGLILTNGDASKYRFRKLLKYLSDRHPNDGWKQFSEDHQGHYDSGNYFDWKTITVMGHSSGSKVSFHLQHDQADIDRVILLSGPNLVATRAGTSEPGNLSSYITTPGAITLDKIYAFSNTHDPKYPRALKSWRYMTGMNGTVGLNGASASGGWESSRPCTSGVCPPCMEFRPVAPPAGSPIRAIQYAGNTAWCVGQASGFDPIDGDWAHESTTENSSCSGSTPDTCWYLAIWDYMLTN